MSNMYRSSAGFGRRSPSRFFFVLRVIFVLALAVGVFVVAVRWFRQDATAEEESGGAGSGSAGETSDVVATAEATAATPVTISLTPVGLASASGTATRDHTADMVTLTIVAQLPTIDGTTTSYEAWFVKPGITDFFSLGTLFPREDGAWGLVWQQSDALVRSDITDFNRIIVTSEPIDGNPAPSSTQVLVGEF